MRYKYTRRARLCNQQRTDRAAYPLNHMLFTLQILRVQTSTDTFVIIIGINNVCVTFAASLIYLIDAISCDKMPVQVLYISDES